MNWADVRPVIIDALSELEDVQIFLYEPQGAPDTEKIRVSNKRPNMTIGRAVLIALAEIYLLPGYRMVLLEIQKLAYFLQCAGVNLKLNFKKAKYGPYAEELNHVLQRIEGHFFR